MKKIEVTIKSNSKEQRIDQFNENSFKIWVKSPAIDGKANTEMKKILAELFNVHQNQINIIFGWKSKRKIVEIKCLKPEVTPL